MAKERGGRRRGLCPRCQSRLYERALGKSGVKVDLCASCRGMWFDGGELQQHSAAVEGELVPTAGASVSSRVCPRCEVVMTAYGYPGTDVAIDLCEECRGVWLDLGELKRLEGTGKAEGGGFLGLIGRALKGLTSL